MAGFTLVELMITIAVAAILLMIAVPSFRHIILSSRLTTSANAMVDAINLARLDAIKLNATTQFCGSTQALNSNDTLGSACGTHAAAVYSLPQSAATAGEVRAAPQQIADPIQVGSAGVAALRFSGQGFGYAPAGGSNAPFNATVAVICTTELSSDNQRVITMTAGAIVSSTTATGDCP